MFRHNLIVSSTLYSGKGCALIDTRLRTIYRLWRIAVLVIQLSIKGNDLSVKGETFNVLNY